MMLFICVSVLSAGAAQYANLTDKKSMMPGSIHSLEDKENGEIFSVEVRGADGYYQMIDDEETIAEFSSIFPDFGEANGANQMPNEDYFQSSLANDRKNTNESITYTVTVSYFDSSVRVYTLFENVLTDNETQETYVLSDSALAVFLSDADTEN